MKTIFITLNRGITNRNILRSGVLDELAADKNRRIIILAQNPRNLELPDYFLKEFSRDNVKIQVVENKELHGWERLFVGQIKRLTFSKSTRLNMLHNIKDWKRMGKVPYFLYYLILAPLSRLAGVKKLARKLDLWLFDNYDYKKYFDEYKPDLVFATSIINYFDIDFVKEAIRRNIKVVAMPRSWDNIDKFLYRAEPDILLVQSEIMAKEAVRYQAIKPEKIKVVGFPQFDIYSDNKVIWGRKEYCAKKNFNPELPILFLGSEGIWSEGDEKIFGKIVELRNHGQISDCNILIRPHFTNVKKRHYDIFESVKNVHVDRFRESDFFSDNWDPSWEDYIDFTNSLYHCSVMITFNSTLAIDSACFDRPIIVVKYGARIIDGEDRTKVMYETVHYNWVLETKAVSLVDSDQELAGQIEKYLSHPEHKKAERQLLKEKMCYKLDGRSSSRMAQEIIRLLNQ